MQKALKFQKRYGRIFVAFRKRVFKKPLRQANRIKAQQSGFDSERKKPASINTTKTKPNEVGLAWRGGMGARMPPPNQNRIKAQQRGFDSERKKPEADTKPADTGQACIRLRSGARGF